MNEFSRIEDELYSLSSYVHLKFHSKITEYTEGVAKSYYNEYKTSTRNVGSVVIKRKLKYYLTLEYNCKNEERESVMIVPEQMYELLDKLLYIKNTWFNLKNNYNIFGLVNDRLVVLNQRETIFIRCIGDRFIKFDPAIFRSDNGDKPALTVKINKSMIPTLIQPEKLIGMTYLLSTFDMLNFANTSLTLASLRTQPENRVSFVDGEMDDPIITTTGKAGRDFKCNQSNII